MKLYIVSRLENGLKEYGDDLYFLISEQGEVIDYHFSSSKYWARIDLYDNCLHNQKLCKEKFGENIAVLFLGLDDMTDEKLRELYENFN